VLDYDFMRNAFAAATIVALLSGAVGYFLVLRGQTFAGHALSHVGFTGATGASLVGIAPLWGLTLMTVAAGIGMGFVGERLAQRDVAIGMVLALSLGLGLLFLHFYTAAATQAAALLFGNVLAIDATTVWTLFALGLLCLAALAAISRPLLFASLQPELAEAKGVSLRFYAVAFLAIVAVATAECTTIVGVLLVFTLMVAAPRSRGARGALCRGGSGARGGVVRSHARFLYRLAHQLLDHRVERCRIRRFAPHFVMRVSTRRYVGRIRCAGRRGQRSRISGRSASNSVRPTRPRQAQSR
jgi:zinc/manganese transport system permease protein